MTNPREFASTDPSSPSLSGQAGAIHALLKACLVGNGDGIAYGTGPATRYSAGWSVAFEDLPSYKLVLRNSLAAGGSGCYVRIDDSAAQYAMIRVYETMTDIDTGQAQAGTVDLYIPKSTAASSASRAWFLHADGRTFWLGVHINASAVPASTGAVAVNGAYQSTIGAGDFDPFIAGDPGVFCAGNRSNSTAQYHACPLVAMPNGVSSPGGAVAITRNENLQATGALLDIHAMRFTSSAAISWAHGGQSGGLSTPVPGYTSTLAMTAIVGGGGTLRGRLRGLFVPVSYISSTAMLGDILSLPGRPSGSSLRVMAGNSIGTGGSGLNPVGRLLIERFLSWE